jgi:hypothetical protein
MNAVFWDVTRCGTWHHIPEDGILQKLDLYRELVTLLGCATSPEAISEAVTLSE